MAGKAEAAPKSLPLPRNWIRVFATLLACADPGQVIGKLIGRKVSDLVQHAGTQVGEEPVLAGTPGHYVSRVVVHHGQSLDEGEVAQSGCAGIADAAYAGGVISAGGPFGHDGT